MSELPDPVDVARQVCNDRNRSLREEDDVPIAAAMREAMLRWIVERWPSCCYQDFEEMKDADCLRWYGDNTDDWCPACVARREMDR